MAKHLLPRLRIAIVGAGAIGCYYGGKLASFGRDVHFLMRGDTSAVRKSGLRIRGKTENIHVAKVNVHQTAADHLRLTTLVLMDEVIAGANRCGIPLRAAEALEQMKRTETLGACKTSTLIDFEKGKPLELEAIWGEPLRRTVAAGAQMRHLEELYLSLQVLDAQNYARQTVNAR